LDSRVMLTTGETKKGWLKMLCAIQGTLAKVFN
jgi:hypothetical protein